MRSGTQAKDGERVVFRVGGEEVQVYTVDNELRVYADNVLLIIPWATNTIRIRVEPTIIERPRADAGGER